MEPIKGGALVATLGSRDTVVKVDLDHLVTHAEGCGSQFPFLVVGRLLRGADT
jgi:hypothetical protein